MSWSQAQGPAVRAPLLCSYMAAKVTAPCPLTSEGAALAAAPAASETAVDPLHEVYQVTNVLLGSGDVVGGVCLGVHRHSGAAHVLKFLSGNDYGKDEHRELAILQLFQKHPRPNVLTLIADFAPIGPGRPQWVVATPEAECNLRTFMWRHHAEGSTNTRSLGRGGLSHTHIVTECFTAT